MPTPFDIYTNMVADTGMASVVIGANRSVLEVEFNEIQELAKERVKRLSLLTHGNGCLYDGSTAFNSGTLTIQNMTFLIDGWRVFVDNLTMASIVNGDSVYLDVWEKTVAYTDTLKKYGNEQSALTVTNYLKDSRYPSFPETSRRRVVAYTLSKTNVTAGHTYLLLGSMSAGVFTFNPSRIYRAATATALPTAHTVAVRDASGRLAVESPSAEKDAANKAYVDAFFNITTGHSHNGVNSPKLGSSSFVAASVDDTALGNRTVADTVAPAKDSDTLTNLLSGIAYQLKALIGETGWRIAPARSIKQIVADMGNLGITVTGAASTIINADLTADKVLVSDSTGKVAVSGVSTTELGYLSGVTGVLQTQINSKQPTVTGAATTIVSADLAVSKALVSDASGKVAVADVSAVELGYVKGVTSSIQTQLNSKQASITGAATSILSANLTVSRVLVSDASGKVAASDVTTSELATMKGIANGTIKTTAVYA